LNRLVNAKGGAPKSSKPPLFAWCHGSLPCQSLVKTENRMFQFAVLNHVYWFLILPIVLILFAYGGHRKKARLRRFAGAELPARLANQHSPPKERVRIVLLILGLVFLIFTLMRPQGNPVTQTVKKSGRDLVFVIDVSKSMLAEDLGPNRLGKARQIVSEVVDILEGDRVGLLVFAGATAVKCPLTLDYNYFKTILNRIGPADINRGGTHIGDAIRVVAERLFYDQDNKYRDVILITDGEDHQSFPLEAAEEARKKGIKIHTVGMGDPEGSNIPIRKSGSYRLLKYRNKTVTTRLDEETLKKIAEITNGIFIPVRTNLVDLADLYQKYIATEAKREMESKESKIWSELYPFFLGIALILLIFEALIGERKIGL